MFIFLCVIWSVSKMSETKKQKNLSWHCQNFNDHFAQHKWVLFAQGNHYLSRSLLQCLKCNDTALGASKSVITVTTFVALTFHLTTSLPLSWNTFLAFSLLLIIKTLSVFSTAPLCRIHMFLPTRVWLCLLCKRVSFDINIKFASQ